MILILNILVSAVHSTQENWQLYRSQKRLWFL